jgi:hypothetical protein
MTPRIKKAYRHFNAFLQRYQCRQSFWGAVQKAANSKGQTYQNLKTNLLCCHRPQDWIYKAFGWFLHPLDKTNLTWGNLDRLWDKYCCNHHYFMR